MDQQYFYLTTEDGVEMKYKVLFTFDTDDHSYCIYTIIDEDGNESEEISAVRYELDENLEMTNFQELETEEEWDMVEEVYNTLVDTFSEEERDAFIATDEEGNEIECKVIYRFTLDEFGKNMSCIQPMKRNQLKTFMLQATSIRKMVKYKKFSQ